MPIGGVMMPIVMFRSMTMPNCTGSTPSFLMIGSTMGAVRMSSGIGSSRHPRINRKMLIKSSSANLSVVSANSQSASRCDVPSNA